MGGGKSSGNQSNQVQMTPEQTQALQAQTNFLTGTAFPAYQNTVAGAGNVYNQVAPNVQSAANTAQGLSTGAAGAEALSGLTSLAQGQQGLSSVFSPQYEQQQVQAALEPAMESAREAVGGQNAAYGAAGELGSSRAALANANLNSLNTQRLGTIAAQTQQGIEANRLAASQALYGGGTSNLQNAQASAGNAITAATAPQNAYGNYASVIFGIPQGNTTPNFSGTQSSTGSNSSSGKGFKLS
jgi:hypothetical protein